MEDRYNFRCGISTSYRNEEDEEKEISLIIEPADVFLSQSSVSIWHEDLRKLLEEKIAGTEHEEYLEDIMDRFEEDNENVLDGDYLVIECDWFDQCTGLKDKNGKLIYERDIVVKQDRVFIDVDEAKREFSNKELEDIYYEQRGDRIKIIQILHSSMNCRDRFYEILIEHTHDTVTLNRFPRFWLEGEEFGYEGECLESPKYWRVVGNIHENPELLKGGVE